MRWNHASIRVQRRRFSPPGWIFNRVKPLATLALGSRPVEGREGEGQTALLHRCILDAAEAGCDMIVIANAGQEPPPADRESLVRAGFETAFQVPTWSSRVNVEV